MYNMHIPVPAPYLSPVAADQWYAHKVDRNMPNLSSGTAEAKGLCVCVCNVCLYRQVIYVYVKGPVKRDRLPPVGNIEEDCV